MYGGYSLPPRHAAGFEMFKIYGSVRCCTAQLSFDGGRAVLQEMYRKYTGGPPVLREVLPVVWEMFPYFGSYVWKIPMVQRSGRTASETWQQGRTSLGVTGSVLSRVFSGGV